MPEFGIPVFLDTPRGTIAFNGDPFSAGVPQYRLDEFTLTSAIRQNAEDVPGRDGSIVSDVFGKGFTATLKGSIRAASTVDRAAALDTIRGYCRSLRRADGILRWTPTGMTERRIVVRLLDDPLDGGSVVKTFQIGLISGSAVAESSALKSFDTAGLTASLAGGVEFPVEFPANMGDQGSSGQAVVTNAGDDDAYPVVRVFGAIAAPIIRNMTTGKYVSLPGLTLNAGDFAEIDMKAETVVLNGAQTFSLISFLDVSASQFWTLPPGASTVALTGASPDVNAKATVIYRDTYA